MKTIEELTLDLEGECLGEHRTDETVIDFVKRLIAAWQEQQEPFAWACWLDKDNEHLSIDARLCQYEPKSYKNRKPLYLATPPAQGEQK